MVTKKQRRKVIMLPTRSGENTILLRNGNLEFEKRFMTKAYLESVDIIANHLYIISDEKIKEGDWCLEKTGLGYMNPIKATKQNIKVNEYFRRCKKIITTTNKSLILEIDCPDGINDCEVYHTKILPQPSQQFIKRYCELGGIDTVLVEYENKFCWKCKDTIVNSVSCEGHNLQLKVNSQNEIIIHSSKNSWNRQEIEEKLNNISWDIGSGMGMSQELIDNFIKENL